MLSKKNTLPEENDYLNRCDINLTKQEIFSYDSDSKKFEIFTILKESDKYIFPDEFLPHIRENKQEYDFDKKVIEKFFMLVKNGNISIDNNSYTLNIHPETLLEPKFLYFIRWLVIKYWCTKNLSYISFEILETIIGDNISEENITLMNKVISQFYEEFWITSWIDDFPEENNNMDFLSKIKGVHFVKIDKKDLLNFYKNEISLQSLLIKINTYCKIIKILQPWVDIVIEGVEDKHLLRYLRKEIPCITYFQWYGIDIPKEI